MIKPGWENIGLNHHDLEFINLLFNIIPKTKPTEEKLGKLDFIKIKIIFAVKGTMEKVKKKNNSWIFANHRSDKGIVSRIKNSHIPTLKRQIDQLKNGWRI